MAQHTISPYFPQFLWKFWISDDVGPTKQCSFDDHRVHIYDVYNNELSELRRIPMQTSTIFQDFYDEALDEEHKITLRLAEATFARLEGDVEHIVTRIVHTIHTAPNTPEIKTTLSMDNHTLHALRAFFAFLRYRNSDQYCKTLESLGGSPSPDGRRPTIRAFRKLRRLYLLNAFRSFLRHPFSNESENVNLRVDELDRYCWRLSNAEVCIGVGSEGNEFILPDTCFGVLDDNFGNNPECPDIFFPVTPRIAVYILGDADASPKPSNVFHDTPVLIDYGIESPSDIHLRNAALLQKYPQRLIFSSLPSIVLSISSYDEFRTPEHLDYSRLKHRCRQKSTQESVTKTLVIRSSIMVTDLTEAVVRLGDSAVAHGSFSDVWKGVWNDQSEKKPRMVALKLLRQVMVQNVREKLLKRLKDEVIAWHRLQHPHIAELYGIVQALGTIGMVSPWCDNGTITCYLEKVNPSANRLELLVQIASGVLYLHEFKPIVIHGDLKGGNILINDRGKAIITDFGLSKVMEEFSDSLKLTTSFFAGSTRWMAPELIFALVEDDGRPPPITTYSDVYAFASVCLEIATGQVPYPHRTNDHSVTVDIIRGIKPSGNVCLLHLDDPGSFWHMLDRCWDLTTHSRPSMSEMTGFLNALL